MKRRCLIIVCCLLVAAVAAGCDDQVFDGSRTGNSDQFALVYSALNGTKTHEMQLDKGDVINVAIESKSGRVDILVADVDGNELYRGNNASSGEFKLIVYKAGLYGFSVTGKKAAGSVVFKVERG